MPFAPKTHSGNSCENFLERLIRSKQAVDFLSEVLRHPHHIEPPGGQPFMKHPHEVILLLFSKIDGDVATADHIDVPGHRDPFHEVMP